MCPFRWFWKLPTAQSVASIYRLWPHLCRLQWRRIDIAAFAWWSHSATPASAWPWRSPNHVRVFYSYAAIIPDITTNDIKIERRSDDMKDIFVMVDNYSRVFVYMHWNLCERSCEWEVNGSILVGWFVAIIDCWYYCYVQLIRVHVFGCCCVECWYPEGQ